jgi:predicted nucleic acid-binding protein
MIYLDTSCLVKLLHEESDSTAVRAAVEIEEAVVISSLAELEAEVQLKAFVAGGRIRMAQWRRYQAKLVAMRNYDLFHFRSLAAGVFSTALRQHRNPQAAYCRTLDRLHLAAMEELRLTRLMTLDDAQAKAAVALNYRTVSPGRRE